MGRTNWEKLISVLVVICMVLGMIPGLSMPSYAEDTVSGNEMIAENPDTEETADGDSKKTPPSEDEPAEEQPGENPSSDDASVNDEPANEESSEEQPAEDNASVNEEDKAQTSEADEVQEESVPEGEMSESSDESDSTEVNVVGDEANAVENTELTLFSTVSSDPANYSVGDSTFTYLQDALDYAADGAEGGLVVMLAQTETITSDITIPSGVTLLLPYGSDYTVNGKGDNYPYANAKANGSYSNISWENQNKVHELVLSGSGTSLNIGSGASLVLGGQYSASAGPGIGGQTCGNHSDLYLGNGTEVNVFDGGILSTVGYIIGNGEINIENGGKLYEPFVVFDYQGGAYTSVVYMARKHVPFNCYTLPNVQCTVNMDGRSYIYGYCDLYAGDQHNATCAVVVGPESGTGSETALLGLDSKTDVTFEYDEAASLSSHENIGRTIATIEGDAALGSLILSVRYKGAPIEVSTSSLVFSLPYNYSFTQKSGTLTISSKVRLMPGTEVEICEDAELDISSYMAVLDGANIRAYRDYVWPYPNSAQLTAGGFSERARLYVDGTMYIRSGATFMGTVESSGTGILYVENGAVLSGTVGDGALSSDQLVSGLDNITISPSTMTSYDLVARIGDTDGEGYQDLTGGKSYYAFSGDVVDTATGFAYKHYNDDGSYVDTEVTFETAEEICGAWSTGFTAVFDANGGAFSDNSTVISRKYAPDTKLVVPENPVRANYTFAGWNTKENGSGEDINPAKLDRQDVTLYAQWEGQGFTVTLDADGGTVSTTTISVAYGGEYRNLPIPEKTGYRFVNWVHAGTETVVKNGDTVTSYADHTLTAMWTPITYTVVFNKNADDATGEMASIQMTYDVPVTLKLSEMSFERSGYTFTGWLDDQGSSPYVYDESGTDSILVLDNLTTTDGDIVTLSAQWGGDAVQYTVRHHLRVPGKADEYTVDEELLSGYIGGVTAAKVRPYKGYISPERVEQKPIIDANVVVDIYYECQTCVVTFVDGNITVGLVEIDYGDVLLKTHVPAREGYDLIGVYYQANLRVEYPFTNEITTNRTLYTTWSLQNYTVNFDLNGADGSAPEDITVTYGEAYGTLPTVSREGYAFLGWFTAPEAGTQITSGNIVGVEADDQVLYAHWEVQSYNLSWDFCGGEAESEAYTGNGTYLYGSGITAPVLTKEGYTFRGWSQEIPATMPAQDLTIKANWMINRYEITWKKNETDANPVVQTYDYGATVTAPDFVNSGYTFTAWLDTDNDGITDAVPAVMPAKNLVFTAAWDLADVTITFQNDGKTYTSITGKYQTAISAPTAPVKEGYTFSGWYADETCTGEAYVFAAMPAESITLYAKWDVNVYSLTWNTNGGQLSGEYTAGDVAYNAPVTAPAVEKQGYTFAGWDAGTDGERDTLVQTMPAQNLTYTALWMPKPDTEYTVETYVMGLNGTYGEPVTVTHYGTTDSVITLSPDAKNGFTVNDQKSVQTGSISGDGKLVLKVYYDRNQYDLAWNANEGTLSGTYTSGKVYYGAPITAPTATKTGYTFAGWTPAVADTMPAADVTYAAGWSINEHTITYMVDGVQHGIVEAAFGEELTAIEQPVKEGYTFSGWNGLPETMPDSNVTVTGSFTANRYTVTFHINDGVKETTAVQDFVYDQKQSLTACETMGFANTGYVFKGWQIAADEGNVAYTDGQEVQNLTAAADGNVDLYAVWEAGQNTPYTVVHKQQNAEDDEYTIAATQKLSGVTGGMTAAAANTYQGFKTPSVTQQTIAADGSTVVELLYQRNVWTVTFEDEGKNVSEKELRYGAAVSAPERTKAGYLLNWRGWSDGMTMPDQNVTITAVWAPAENTAYTVEIYVMGLDGAYGEPVTVTHYGTTDFVITLSPDAKNGFTLDETGSELKGKITGDGKLVLKVYYIRNQYNLMWMPAGGVLSGEYTSGLVYYGASIAVPAVAREGYSLNGWSGYSEDMTMPAENTTFTAQWSANTNTEYRIKTYRMKLDGGYELICTETEVGTTGAPVAVTPEEQTGFTVNQQESSLTGQIDGDGSLILNVYYDRNQYDLVWTVDGSQSDGAYSKGKLYYETTITAPAAPEKVGYTFAGWDSNQDGVAEIVPATMPAQNLAFSALWTPDSGIPYKVNTYIMGVDGQYGMPETEEKAGTTAEIITVSPVAPEGFTLNTEKSVLRGAVAGDGSLVLEVYLDRNQYRLRWVDNGGSLKGDYTTGAVYFGTSITLPEASRSGYRFEGWYTDAELTQPYTAGNMPASDLTLYADWEVAQTTYTVKHLREDLEGAYTIEELQTGIEGITGQLTAAEAKVYEGFTAQAVTQVAIAGDGTTVVEVRYSRNSYDLTAQYADGVTADKVVSFKFEAPVTPELLGEVPARTGYTFALWNGLPEVMPAEPVTVTAKWDVVAYALYCDLDNGTLESEQPDSFTIESPTFTLTNPTRTGYTFAGWTGTGLTNATMELTIPNGSTGHRLYKATWTANTYTVIFDANNGSGETVQQSFVYDLQQNLTVNGFSSTGYTFIGWNTAADGSGTDYEDRAYVGNLTDSGETTLYAQWEGKTYTVRYYGNTGTGSMDNQSFVYGSGAVLNENAFTLIGHIHNGWNTEADGSGTAYAEGASLDGVAANLHLYAQWTPITYTVKYDANGGEGSMADQAFTYGVPQKLLANSFTREGYAFNGWLGGAATYEEAEEVNNLSSTQCGEIVMVAQWKVQAYTLSFDPANGTESTASSVNYGAAITVPADPIWSGYRFDGWEPEVLTNMPAQNVTYTAQWTSYLELLLGITDFSGENLIVARKYFALLTPAQRTTYNKEHSTHKATFFAAIEETSIAKLKESVESAAIRVSNAEDMLKGIAVITIDGDNAYVCLEDSNYVATNLLGIDFLPELLKFEEIQYAHFPNLADSEEGLTPYYKDDTTGEMNQMDLMMLVAYDALAEEDQSMGDFLIDMIEGDTVTVGLMDGAAVPVEAHAVTAEGVEYSVTYALIFYNRYHNVIWDPANGEASESVSYAEGEAIKKTASVPVWENHTFLGWEGYAGNAVMGRTDIVYKAKWQIQQYTVTFSANGGESAPDAQVVDHGAFAVEPEAPVRQDYLLTGWSVDAAGTKLWNFETDSVTADIILYAQWKHVQHSNETTFDWKNDVCRATTICSVCKESIEEEVLFVVENGKLAMSHVPDNLRLIIAGYTGDKLTGAQVVKNPQLENAINVSGDEIVIFFLNDYYQPLRKPLTK